MRAKRLPQKSIDSYPERTLVIKMCAFHFIAFAALLWASRDAAKDCTMQRIVVVTVWSLFYSHKKRRAHFQTNARRQPQSNGYGSMIQKLKLGWWLERYTKKEIESYLSLLVCTIRARSLYVQRKKNVEQHGKGWQPCNSTQQQWAAQPTIARLLYTMYKSIYTEGWIFTVVFKCTVNNSVTNVAGYEHK